MICLAPNLSLTEVPQLYFGNPSLQVRGNVVRAGEGEERVSLLENVLHITWRREGRATKGGDSEEGVGGVGEGGDKESGIDGVMDNGTDAGGGGKDKGCREYQH